jgi:hypothetical protein
MARRVFVNFGISKLSMLDSDLNTRFEQAEQSQHAADDVVMQLATVVASALQKAGYSATVLEKQQDTASRQ